MVKKILILIITFSTIQLKGQTVDISFSIVDSCINQTKDMVAIQIIVQNRTPKNIWIDLKGVTFFIYQDDKLITPFEKTLIGLFSSKEKITKNGYLRIKKMSNETAIIYTSLFRNYKLDVNKKYFLIGFYKSDKKKAVYNIETDMGKIFFKICN